MAFPILVLAAIAMFWVAGEVQTLNETLITWAAYGLSFYLGVYALLGATALMSGDDE